jgi:hypothetical protein
MAKYRQAARVDANQAQIVKDLRTIHGLSVELGHDDLLVGWKGQCFWYEVKDPNKTINKDGTLKLDALKPSQKKLLAEWTGHYKVVFTTDDILKDLGILRSE